MRRSHWDGAHSPTRDRRPRLHIWALVLSAFAGLVFARPASAIEEPKFTVLLKDGVYEIRRYEPYVVAEVVVSGDQGEAVQKGFRTLAGYIFGGNAGKAKIAMTAPVAQRPEGRTMVMTSPVTLAADGPRRWTVQFMMPAAYSLASLPRPNDPDIRFRSEPAREMAVVRFSGVARGADYRMRTEALARWIAARRMKARGDATLAQYDPPWTPWFLRRNEILIEVGPR